MDTGGRKWGRPYLTRAFFARIAETMADCIVLMLAEKDGQFVAGVAGTTTRHDQGALCRPENLDRLVDG